MYAHKHIPFVLLHCQNKKNIYKGNFFYIHLELTAEKYRIQNLKLPLERIINIRHGKTLYQTKSLYLGQVNSEAGADTEKKTEGKREKCHLAVDIVN